MNLIESLGHESRFPPLNLAICVPFGLKNPFYTEGINRRIGRNKCPGFCGEKGIEFTCHGFSHFWVFGSLREGLRFIGNYGGKRTSWRRPRYDTVGTYEWFQDVGLGPSLFVICWNGLRRVGLRG